MLFTYVYICNRVEASLEVVQVQLSLAQTISYFRLLMDCGQSDIIKPYKNLRMCKNYHRSLC